MCVAGAPGLVCEIFEYPPRNQRVLTAKAGRSIVPEGVGTYGTNVLECLAAIRF